MTWFFLVHSVTEPFRWSVQQHSMYVCHASECWINRSHKSHNAPVTYPTIHHSAEKCAYFCSESWIVGYGISALWDLWNWSIGQMPDELPHIQRPAQASFIMVDIPSVQDMAPVGSGLQMCVTVARLRSTDGASNECFWVGWSGNIDGWH